MFRAMVNGEEYKLNVNLFDAIAGNVQHTSNGAIVRVTMTKKKVDEWPRLTSSKEKLCNVKYDLTKIKIDEGKKRRFLELDDGLEDEDTDEETGGTYMVYGSDESESEDSFDFDDS